MIYKDTKLRKQEYIPLFAERTLISECSDKITTILGNHRDKDNIVGQGILDFEKNKMIKKALEDILKIKEDLYNSIGVKL